MSTKNHSTTLYDEAMRRAATEIIVVSVLDSLKYINWQHLDTDGAFLAQIQTAVAHYTAELSLDQLGWVARFPRFVTGSDSDKQKLFFIEQAIEVVRTTRQDVLHALPANNIRDALLAALTESNARAIKFGTPKLVRMTRPVR